MIGKSIGAYRLVRELGDGGQGSVYEAVRETDGSRVALKVIHAHLRHELAERVRREARLLAAIADDGLPRFVELVEDVSGPVAIAMELIDGVPMTAAIAVQAMNSAEKHAFLVELARILAVLHGKGAVHRDVKQGNVLVRHGGTGPFRGRVVLVDLALAKENWGSGGTQAGLVMGTPQFLGPEFLLGKRGSTDATAAADIFGWGIIAWLVLFGHHPTGLSLDADPTDFMRAYSHGNQTWLRPTAAEALARYATYAGLVTAAIRALRDDPGTRPQNGAELLNVLQQWGAPTGVDALARPGQFTALKVETWKGTDSSGTPSASQSEDRSLIPIRSLPLPRADRPRRGVLPWVLLAGGLLLALLIVLSAVGAWFLSANAEPVASAPPPLSIPPVPVPAAVPVEPKPTFSPSPPELEPESPTEPEPKPTPPQAAARGGLVTITVNVKIDPRKRSGAKWDAFDSTPEPSLTARVGSSGRLLSASGGSSTNFSAKFPNVRLSAQDTLSLTLVDRDVSANDPIGSFRAFFHGHATSAGGRADAASFRVAFTEPR